MTTLYALTDEYRRLLEAGDHDPDTGEVLEGDAFELALRGLEGEIEHKAESCAVVLRQMDATADMIKAEERRLKARREAIEANAKRLKT